MGSYSEIASLQKILIHSPDAGIAKVTPDLATALLYEDIVSLHNIQEEHFSLKAILRAYVGEQNCLEIADLFAEVLQQQTVREEFVHYLLELEGKAALKGQLLDMTPSALSHYSIEGDVEASILPVPNFIFTRDIGSVAGPFLLHATAAKKARARESLISWFVFHHHPHFKAWSSTGKILSPANSLDEMVAFLSASDTKPQLEGGDMMMMDTNHLLIACSERTNERGIALVKKKIQSMSSEIEYLSVAYLPESRYCMHWDTVFTFTNHHEAVGYGPLLNSAQGMSVKTMALKEDHELRFDSFPKFLSHVLPALTMIPCGKGLYPYDQREQWTDACNFFALKPGLVIAYDRNEKTLEAFQERGYAVREANHLLAKHTDIRALEKTIITLKSSELSRARGGPHCLTFPLDRI
jgi:arginine deiminase